MSNNIYDSARYSLLTAGINWPALDIVVTAWGDPPYFYEGDKKISDILARGITTLLAHSDTVTSKTVSPDGTAQTNQVLIKAVPIGKTVTHFTLSKRYASVNQSDLILYVDEAENLPFDPNGLDLVLQPDWLQERGWFRP